MLVLGKWHAGFRLVPKVVTLSDLELAHPSEPIRLLQYCVAELLFFCLFT